MIRFGFKQALLTGALAGLAGCEATPRYAVDGSGVAGEGGLSVAQPRFPINGVAPPPAPAPASPSSAPQAEGYASSPDEGPPPRAAPSSHIQTQSLGAPGSPPPASPPPYRPGAAPRPYPATDAPPPGAAPGESEDADLRGRQSSGASRLRPAPPPALETPRTVQVQPFESVYDVAERVRTPIRAIIDLNGLKPPYTLKTGAILRIPPPAVYTVSEGDTLFGVARRFSIDPRSLANLNDIPMETRVRPGQRLALPSLVRDKGVNTAARGARPEGLHDPSENIGANLYARPSQTQTQAQAQAQAPALGRPTAKVDGGAESPPRADTPPASDSQVVALGKGRFVWPLKGAILSSFGPKGAGQRNDGVNIAAATGDSVKAAAAGTVVYAGNSIPAFGNLVLIKHPGGWASLYGNLGRITVKNNAQVSQGQEVGTAGVSGAVDRPQVHFEIRYAQNAHDKAKPYDPAGLLP